MGSLVTVNKITVKNEKDMATGYLRFLKAHAETIDFHDAPSPRQMKEIFFCDLLRFLNVST